MSGNLTQDDDTLDGNNSLDDGHETDTDRNVRLGSFDALIMADRILVANGRERRRRRRRKRRMRRRRRWGRRGTRRGGRRRRRGRAATPRMGAMPWRGHQPVPISGSSPAGEACEEAVNDGRQRVKGCTSHL